MVGSTLRRPFLTIVSLLAGELAHPRADLVRALSIEGTGNTAGRAEQAGRHEVRVGRRGGAAVLKVSAVVLLRLVGDADRRVASADAERELVELGRLVLAGEAQVVVCSVKLDVSKTVPRRRSMASRMAFLPQGRAFPWWRSWCAHRYRSSRPARAWRRS